MQRALRKLLGYSEPNAAPTGFDGAWTGRGTTQSRRLEERSVRNGRPAATRIRSGHPQPQVVQPASSLAGASSGPIVRDTVIDNVPAALQSSHRHGAPAAGVAPAYAATAVAPVSAPPAAVAPAAAPTAALAEEGARAGEVRASSLPQPLAQAGQQPAAAGSGPGAPVSPDPAAPPPVLRRVSSTPCPAGLFHGSLASTHSSMDVSAAATEEGAGGSSKEGSRRSGLSATCSGSLDAAAAAAAAALLGAPAVASRNSNAAATRQLGEAAAATGLSPHRSTSPPAPPRWHPAMGPLPAEQVTPAWAKRTAQQQQQQQQQPRDQGVARQAAPLAVPQPPRVAVPAAGAAAAAVPEALPVGEAAAGSPLGSPLSLDAPALGTSQGSVSLLTYQLRGPSAASSAAASRESSVRSGIKRQPGGLTLALSRENSLRGGSMQQQREGSVRSERERSVRDGSQRGQSMRDSSHRSASLRSGGGRQEGSVLAQWGAAAAFGGVPPVAPPRGGPRAALEGAALSLAVFQQQQQAPPPAAAALLPAHAAPGPAAGCGSGDWMGLPPLSELQHAPLLDEAADPFAGPDALLSAPAAAPAAAELPAKPHDVGSWAKRVTKFSHKAEDSASTQQHKHAGGPDPLLLTAALEALVTPTSSSGAGSGPGCGDVLVGDSDLALTSSHEMMMHCCPREAAAAGGRPPTGASPSLGAPPRLQQQQQLSVSAGACGAQLSSSWGAPRGCAAAAAAHMLPVVTLGGSAPTRGLSLRNGSSRGSVGPMEQQHAGSEPLGSDVTADAQEWNRNFQKRWRAVKKRAYLQALGLRALWRVNSVSDRHEPLELLTNDLPQCDNGMRRAWSVSRLAQREEAAAAAHGSHHHHRGAASASQPALRRPGSSTLHKDPSLAALLLGEVAEVC